MGAVIQSLHDPAERIRSMRSLKILPGKYDIPFWGGKCFERVNEFI